MAAHSKTQTFAVGPELVYRHFKQATFFVRPVYAGIIHETATPQPTDPVLKALVSELISTPTKTDNVFFFGFGGGFDILFGNHFAWRTQADLVHDHLFNDLLTNGRYTVRFSCGPAFNFGKNIAARRLRSSSLKEVSLAGQFQSAVSCAWCARGGRDVAHRPLGERADGEAGVDAQVGGDHGTVADIEVPVAEQTIAANPPRRPPPRRPSDIRPECEPYPARRRGSP